LVLLVPSIFGRGVESWPYERLFKEAELVVIANATASADAGEKVKHKDWNTEFIGVNTTFEVRHVIKGKLEGKELKLFHLRAPEGVKIQNGPGFVSFRLKEVWIKGPYGKMGTGKPAYLLFLKKSKEGRWQAVSGQIDPNGSVREMYPANHGDDLDSIHNRK
jgi:hypothetical protein